MGLVCRIHECLHVFYFIVLEKPIQYKFLECRHSNEDGNKFSARKSAIPVDFEELEMYKAAWKGSVEIETEMFDTEISQRVSAKRVIAQSESGFGH